MPLIIFLTGCVTYYYPETAFEDGVYYAEDDPSYVLNSSDYSGVVYYPWSSLDYFYMGYWPYPGYGFVYGYPFGLGYSPWDYPNGYYGYYSPRYFSHHYGSYWRSHRRNCSYPGNCSRRNNGDRYAVDNPGHNRNRGREDGGSEGYPPGENGDIDSNNGPLAKRYFMTAPPGYSGNQDMLVRSRENSKMGNGRREPAAPVMTKPVIARSSSAGALSRPTARSSMNTRPPRSSVVSSPSSRQSSGRSRASHRSDRD